MRKNRRALIRQGAGDRRRHVREDDGVVLEDALRRAVAILVGSQGMTEHTITHPENG